MAERTLEITIGGSAHEVRRSRLGGYLRLMIQMNQVDAAARLGDSGAISAALYRYLDIALGIDLVEFNKLPWFDIVNSYAEIVELNVIPGFENYAMLRVSQYKFNDTGEGEGKSIPWDHPGRGSVIWVHMIANAYHWSKSEIEDLWPEEAIGFIQEILADQQSDREFVHSLSKVAYSYSQTTKSSKYVPLKRPMWMLAAAMGKIKKTKLLRILLPMGEVIYPEEEEDLT